MIQKVSPHLKRVLAMCLVLCLLMGNVPINALAEEPGTTTEAVAGTVTGGASADNKTEAEKQNTQEPDTSVSAETPPRNDGAEAEKPNSSQQPSAENPEDAAQPSEDTADPAEPSADASEKTTAPEGTASDASVIGAPASDGSDDADFGEMTPEQEAELKKSLEAAGIDTSDLDLRSLTPEDIQMLLNDPSYAISVFANGPTGGWVNYSSVSCIRATGGRVPGIGASPDGALTYHAWDPNGNPSMDDFATCLESDRLWRSGDNQWKWAEVKADGRGDESPTSGWSSLSDETRQRLVLLAHYGLGGGASKFSSADGSVYAAMQLVAWQWINGRSTGDYTSHYSSHVQALADELCSYVSNNPDKIDASQSTVYLVWPNKQTLYSGRYVWGQSLMKPATVVYEGPTTGMFSLRKVSANDSVRAMKQPVRDRFLAKLTARDAYYLFLHAEKSVIAPMDKEAVLTGKQIGDLCCDARSWDYPDTSRLEKAAAYLSDLAQGMQGEQKAAEQIRLSLQGRKGQPIFINENDAPDAHCYINAPASGNGKPLWAEIDHLIVAPCGIIHIETKTRRGEPHVHGNGSYYFLTGNGTEKAADSMQVTRHDNVIRMVVGDIPRYSIVCFADDSNQNIIYDDGVKPEYVQFATLPELSTVLDRLLADKTKDCLTAEDVKAVARRLRSARKSY